jgi:hypothetical protein
VQVQPVRLVPRAEDRHGFDGDPGRKRHFGERSAVREAETQLAVRLPIDLVAPFVNGAMMPVAEHREIRQRGGATVRPVTDVMALAEARCAAGEPTAPIAVVERSP